MLVPNNESRGNTSALEQLDLRLDLLGDPFDPAI
jgi:hypothetical protein